jgi:lipoprotein-anchoring transpeptidase ErfK/SrfK
MAVGRIGRFVGILAVGGALVPAIAAAQAPVTPAPAPPAPPAALPAGLVAPGVTIAGVPVGGLYRGQAREAVLAQYVAPRRTPVVVTFRNKRLGIKPVNVGYTAKVDYAVKVALLYGRSRVVPAEGVDVPLHQSVNRKRLKALLELRSRANGIPARDAALSFKGATPVVRKPRVGLRINVSKAMKTVERAIFLREKPVYSLPAERVRPEVTSVGPAIIIERNRYRLTLWRAGKRQTFGIAVGQSAHPTPTGRYRIVTKQTNPTWFPPDSPWAAGLGPVPPGVNNPLGTRWMGTSAPAIGIHGTPLPGTIGTAASHGCIRMRISDAEYLYERIEIGTPVVIV